MSIANTAHSVVEPSPGTRRLAGSLVVLYAVITMIPLVWIVLTSFKSPDDAISYPPKVVFTPSLEGYCNLFTTRTRQTDEYIQALGPPKGVCDEVTRRREMVIAQRRRLHEALAELPLEAPSSEAHFVWMRAGEMSSMQLAAAFQRAGVIVFPGSVLGDADHVRVSLKSALATDRLLAVLPGIGGSDVVTPSAPMALADLEESAA